MPANTGPSWVLSCRWPGVMTIDSGRSLPSQARCTLLVSSPRLRPSPSSGGWRIPTVLPHNYNCTAMGGDDIVDLFDGSGPAGAGAQTWLVRCLPLSSAESEVFPRSFSLSELLFLSEDALESVAARAVPHGC